MQTILHAVFSNVVACLNTLFLSTPEKSLWSACLIWVVRVVTFALLLRTYIVPSILRIFSNSIRVRSISLRSIRGIYFKAGMRTWHVERIRWSYHSPCAESDSRISVRIEGLKLEIDGTQTSVADTEVREPRSWTDLRLPTRSDFALSPVGVWIRFFAASVYSLLEPKLRPVLRIAFVTSLRLLIRLVPPLTQIFEFELDSAVITFAALSGASVVIKDATLHTKVAFTQLENVIFSEAKEVGPPRRRHTRFKSVIDWKDKLSNSVERAWERAWGKTQGSASINLKVHRVTGFNRPFPTSMLLSLAAMGAGLPLGSCFNFPGVLDFMASVRFNPRLGDLEPHSLKTALKVDAIHVDVDSIFALLAQWKSVQDAQKSAEPMSPLSPSAQGHVLSPSPSMATVASPSPASRTKAWRESFYGTALLRRKRKPIVVHRVSRVKHSALLSVLESAELRISTICAIHKVDRRLEGTNVIYKATASDISFGAHLSNPQRGKLHAKWLGTHDTKKPDHNPDAYAFVFVVDQISVDQIIKNSSTKVFPVLSVGRTELQILISEWPSSWLRGTSYMTGNPNGPFLGVRFTVASVVAQYRLGDLRRLFEHKDMSYKPSSKPSPVPDVLSPMPRFSIEVEIGDLVGRLVDEDSVSGGNRIVLEGQSGGIVCSSESHFTSVIDRYRGHSTDDLSADISRVRLDMVASIMLQSPCVRLLPRDAHDKTSITTSASDQGSPIFYIETLEMKVKGSALGHVTEVPSTAISLDCQSALIDAHCASDAITIELWQPDVVEAVREVLAALQSPTQQSHQQPSRQSLDKLPFGLSASFSVARVAIMLCGHDINPTDALELGRGIKLSTGFSVQYSALQPQHLWDFAPRHQQSEMRSKLYLSEEHIAAAARSARVEKADTAFLRIQCWDITIRSAVSTQFEFANFPQKQDKYLDEPYSYQDFMAISRVRIDVALSTQRGGAFPIFKDHDMCHVSLELSRLNGTFRVYHIYSLLLAVKVLQTLKPPAQPSARPRGNSHVSYSFRGKVQVAQFLWIFSEDQRLCTRVDSIVSNYSPGQTVSLRWARILFWVPLPPNPKNPPEEILWSELGRLLEGSVALPVRPDGPQIISVDIECARLHLPHDYVIADLIQQISINLKALRHLQLTVSDGKYSEIAEPEAEAAKSMPDLRLHIKSLTLEASDDPFESKLGLIYQTGFVSTKVRETRNQAFESKATTVLAAEDPDAVVPPDAENGYHFTSAASVSIQEAHERLLGVHSADWIQRHRRFKAKQIEREAAASHSFCQASTSHSNTRVPNIVRVVPVHGGPPLVRVAIVELSLRASPPSFTQENLPEFLHHRGRLPLQTQYSLLIPMHLNFALNSLKISLRDYPLPLLHVPPRQEPSSASLEFDTDLVIAEEMGTSLSVDWLECSVLDAKAGDVGGAGFSIRVPKTIMPVKTYATPLVKVTADRVTDFSWGVSYGPATQDLMRVVDTLTTSPKDCSPAVGFWDKLRLSFHWEIRVHFADEVHLHMKGSRDPYDVAHHGAGFALCWQGKPRLNIGVDNPERELVQLTSENMLLVIPNLESDSLPRASSLRSSGTSLNQPTELRQARKVCAKLGAGVRFGVGFLMERACGPECGSCRGSPFYRKCRFFDFKPHYQVILEQKSHPPLVKTFQDSFNDFRSDFIHMSISLTSSLNEAERQSPTAFSSFHLSPQMFSHFWSWWMLFDGDSLPIRQGNIHAMSRPPSPKFTRHLATLKYRIGVEQLFISHSYIDDSSESWADGITPFVGMKALIGQFHADMHQREQEVIVPGSIPGTTKVTFHKKFYAAEVVLKELDLRAILATFKEPMKRSVPLQTSLQGSRFSARTTSSEPPSHWIDMDDFVETDFRPAGTPIVQLIPVAACPRFTYFKGSHHSRHPQSGSDTCKFGEEDSHICFLGKESSVSQIQIELASARVRELRQVKSRETDAMGSYKNVDTTIRDHDSHKMITLLEAYVAHLRALDAESRRPGPDGAQNYYMPSDSVSADEWAEFDNVYQVHCPKIFMSNSVRDVLLQYYYCSRSRRGLEYHMATRAIKYMRDQAEAALLSSAPQEPEKPRGAAASAQAAAHALRRIITGDPDAKPSVEVRHESPRPADALHPLSGWGDGISLRQSHFCLLLKPQILLRSEASPDSVSVLAAVQAKLQSLAIMDQANMDDPVNGKIMSRTYTSLTGLQAFYPCDGGRRDEGCVPLEVLVDLRCESKDFDRLVPQTDATFRYDKFNRLRLRNNLTSIAPTSDPGNSHLQHQTDLVQVNVPRFTVSANEKHFQSISTIITDLVLFSDAAHKTRLDKLETLLFSYDFTDLGEAAGVVADLQSRIREVVEIERAVGPRLRRHGDEGKAELLRIKAHTLLLADELNLIFDAIKLAQDKADGHTEQKSALLLRTSSSEISWRMLDDARDLLAKLSLQKIDYSWLNRQDSSTENNLSVGDLQAFDGSPGAAWTEIIAKHDEPSNHPLVKRGLFLLANWIVLAPVGGITIYEDFDLKFHPMKLQIDTKVGQRIMEYVWPARKNRRQIESQEEHNLTNSDSDEDDPVLKTQAPMRSSLELPRPIPHSRMSGNILAPPLRRLGASRSFTDLRSAASDTFHFSKMQRTPSSYREDPLQSSASAGQLQRTKVESPTRISFGREGNDAAEMRTRSSQKSFIRVRVDSLHLLLSIMKEDSFLCRDAHIRTRELVYRNQTWSFDELVDQFIPSDPSWKGWVKLAFQQPLIPVIPVARELFSKTQWIPSKGKSNIEGQESSPNVLIRSTPIGSDSRERRTSSRRPRTASPSRRLRTLSHRGPDRVTSGPLTTEPSSLPDRTIALNNSNADERPGSRNRILKVFTRRPSRPRPSIESDPYGNNNQRRSNEDTPHRNRTSREQG
ncbi:hypothetical protein JAAARDRAFT_145519 [Jaapia argillacea MUCL 33604]|uniref:FMP27 GFWDK domain-containing protein n=1 Tax=Jaapia argillacea MUCL 33604 TaxID=933084 RepID=A0A067QCC2_9AGAM|nr:hypothetical protein JAAARDRAFT_145519 [Jaapia argillacea MUCL 33604]